MNNFDNTLYFNKEHKREKTRLKRNKQGFDYPLTINNPASFSIKQLKIAEHNCSITVKNDQELTVLTPNVKFCKLLGITKPSTAEHNTFHLAELIVPADLNLFCLKLQEMRNEPNLVHCLVRAKRSYLPTAYWLIIGNYKKAEDAYELWIADITSTAKEHQNNSLLYHRLHNFIEMMPDGVLCFRYTPGTQLTYMSRNLQNLLGYNSSLDLLEADYSFAQLIHPDDRNDYIQFLNNMADDGNIYQTDLRLHHHQGHYLWVRAMHHLYTDINNKRYCEVIISDISELVQSKQNASEANRSLERIGNLIPGALGEFTFDGQAFGMQQVNDQFYLLAGTRPDDDAYLDTHCEEEMFCLKEDLPNLIDVINRQLECSTFIQTEFRIEKRDGTVANIRMVGSAVYHPQSHNYQKPLYTLHCLFFDITAEYEAKEKIVYLQQQIDQFKQQRPQQTL